MTTACGGFVEMGTELIPMNTLKGVIHYRRDVHKEWDLDYDPSDGFAGKSPTETSREETWSFAVENTFHAMRNLDFVAGVSYDMNEVLRAEFTESATPRSFARNLRRPVSTPGTGRGPPSRLQPDRHRPCQTCRAAPASRPCSTATAPASAPVPLIRTSTPERATNYELGASDNSAT